MSIATMNRRATRPRHRQFSLRMLLLMVLVAGPVIGFGGPPLHRMALEMTQPSLSPVPVSKEFDCILFDWPLEPDEDFEIADAE